MNVQTQMAQPIRPTQTVSNGLLQRQCVCGNHTTAGGECAECAKKKNTLQRKASQQSVPDGRFSLPHMPVIQRKLTIGASDDPLEREADRVADQVLAAPAHSKVSGVSPHIQRYTGPATGQAVTAPASVDHVLASPGRPLDAGLQRDMGQRFGHDFSQVRVHTDETAVEAAHTLNANAFTVGSHIVFGKRQFAPDTSKGRRLLAHELTHSVQQSAAGIHAMSTIQRDKKTEKEVKQVISPNVQLREGALTEAEGQLAKRVARRQKEIGSLLQQIGPDPKTEAAKKKAQMLKNDLAKDLDTIIKSSDHPSVSEELREDIKDSVKLVSTQKLKLKGAKEQWSKYDPIFAGEEVVKTLGTNSLSAAELKALIAQESGDLTKSDTKGDIAGIAQMGMQEEKRAGGAKGDRKQPKKAIPLAAKVVSLYADDLNKGLSVKPSGVEWKKFIMGAYNGGVNLIVTAQKEAINMKRDGKTWESLINGGEKSPLFEALKKTYKADPKNPNKWADKYKEVTEYVEKIYARLP